MSVYKDNITGKWYAMCRYTNWQGERKQKCKRGFLTRREALSWEREFLMQSHGNTEMTFESYFALYEADVKPRLRLNTWLNKESIIKNLILPYFKDKKLAEITSRDVMAWQSEIRSLESKNGRPYSEDTLQNIHAQLSSMMNHAVKHYGLSSNPARTAGGMGSEGSKEMLFWTQEEYMLFAEQTMDKPVYYYAFEVLYWCGLRVGELLALTPGDFNFENRTLSITKSYQRIRGEDVITLPKTKASKRVISIPDFLVQEIREYIGMYYTIGKDDRLFFTLSKHKLTREMERASKLAGVKRIRLHDLRHSHVSLLINMEFSALEIASRVGHEAIDITFRYAHLFPSAQKRMAEKLNQERGAF